MAFWHASWLVSVSSSEIGTAASLVPLAGTTIGPEKPVRLRSRFVAGHPAGADTLASPNEETTIGTSSGFDTVYTRYR